MFMLILVDVDFVSCLLVFISLVLFDSCSFVVVLLILCALVR